jgi:hypothetical protein
MQKEGVVAFLKVVFQHCSAGSGETQETLSQDMNFKIKFVAGIL